MGITIPLSNLCLLTDIHASLQLYTDRWRFDAVVPPSPLKRSCQDKHCCGSPASISKSSKIIVPAFQCWRLKISENGLECSARLANRFDATNAKKSNIKDRMAMSTS